MINMKVEKKDEEKDGCAPCCIDDNPYGWGLNLYLDDDRMKKFNFDKPLETGTVVRIEALATVTGNAENASLKHGKRVSMDLQITDMELSPQDIKSSMFK